MTNKDNLIGKQLGDYKLTGKLTSGGMAHIYMGVDVKLQRQAAVKILTPDMMIDDETLKTRFEREARAVAALEHDNIITIYAFGEHGEYGEVYFLAMKYVPGKDLAEELNTLRRTGNRMDVKRALLILEQVASALDYAHSKDIIHRDVKPSNILLDKSGKAILTDFGLVLRQSVDQTMGTAFGTPRYISPEQAMASEQAVSQSDIYSLAVVAFEIFTGEMMFRGVTPMEIALSHISDPPPPPRSINPNIPIAVEDAILKALEKTPGKRHKTATEFIDAVKAGYEKYIEAGGDQEDALAASKSSDASGKSKKTGELTPVYANVEMQEAIEAHRYRVQKRRQKPDVKAISKSEKSPLTTMPVPPSEPTRPVSPLVVGIGAIAIIAIAVGLLLLGGGGSETATLTDSPPTEVVVVGVEPTDEVVPTDEPTDVSTATSTDEPTDEPTDETAATSTDEPTDEPTGVPTDEPTDVPTDEPTAVPTDEPTDEPTATPTEVSPTVTPVAIVGGAPVILLYSDQAFAMLNDSPTTLVVRDLMFVRGDVSFSGEAITGGMLPAGECVVILLQRQGVSAESSWGCEGRVHSQHFQPDVTSLFWRNVDADSFEVRQGEVVVASCIATGRATSGDCAFEWPTISEG